MKKRTLWLFLLTGLLACAKEAPIEISGRWTMTMTTATDIPEGLWIVFQNGGKFEGGMPGEPVSATGQWTLKKSLLSIEMATGDWGDSQWNVTVKGEQLILTGPSGTPNRDLTLTFARSG